MVSLILLLSSIGTIALVVLCTSISILFPVPTPTPVPVQVPIIVPGYVEPVVPTSTENLIASTVLTALTENELCNGVAQEVPDELRAEIVRQSVFVLRQNEKSEDEIRQAMEQYFALSGEELDRILNEPVS